ncbi:MAG: metallophosphoesterase, partial [Balneolaceae bacterium]
MKYTLSHLAGLILVAILQAGWLNTGYSIVHAQDRSEGFSIAFMPDVHFHDVFADFERAGFEGLPTYFKGETKGASIRTMEAQLTSTRLFNENYFALIAALEDAVQRGIKIIGLPGDFSDDGQPAHVSGFVKILNRYKEEHGLRFFTVPGNHDPTRPFTQEAGKRDYLGKNGRAQPIFSHHHPSCKESSGRTSPDDRSTEPRLYDVICTDQVKELGYEGLLEWIGEHGIYPDENYIYFETPFSSYDSGNYQFGQAKEEARFSNRLYEICHEGSGGVYRQPGYTRCFDVMDMSYVVEPIEDVWLMGIDANV